MLIMLCLKGDANSFFVFVFNVTMFYFNDDDNVDLSMVIWAKSHPLFALLSVGLVQLLNFVWLCWEFSLWAGV